MGTETYSGPLGDIRGIGTSGGTALTTSSQVIGFPEGLGWLSLTPRNFETAVVARVLKSPYLIIAKTTDALALAANTTDYSSAAQDADAATDVVLSSLDTAANLDFLYVGSWEQFRGVDVDVDAPNGTASVLTVKYWNGSAWADISDTDGTISSGKTMAVDGQVTWAVPTDWATTTLTDANSLTTRGVAPQDVKDIYWTRWEVSAALDSATTLNHMIALNRSTAYAELAEGQSAEMILEGTPPRGYSGIEVLTNAGTGNLLVNGATVGKNKRFV